MGESLINIVHSTGGDVYYGYPSSSLTNVTGNSVDIPPQFIGEDSDGDTIPDIVELYGLKPNGQPINSDPNKKDTDGDGLDDNVEIRYNLNNWTYEVNKSQYDGTVYCGSDPTLVDTDWDTYDDKTEYELGSNPSIANFYIENEDFEFVINNNYYNSEAYRTLYNNSLIESDLVWLGNNVFSSNGDKVELYKKAIIDYLDKMLNTKKTVYEFQELHEVEKSVYQVFDNNIKLAYDALKISGKPAADIKKDTELLNEFQASMQRRLKDMNATYHPEIQTKEAFYKRIDEAMDEYLNYSKKVDSLSKKIKIKNMSIEKLDGVLKSIGFVLEGVNIAFSAKEMYDSYIAFKSNINIMEDGIKLLETFTHSDDVNVKKAALQLLGYANEEYEKASFEWDQVKISIGQDAIYTAVYITISKLPKYGPYASIFIVAIGAISNASEVCKNGEYTFANATVAESLRKEIWSMAKTGEQIQNGISISRDYTIAARRFVNLIVLRINAEEQYITFSKSIPLYNSWGEKENQEHAQNNINILNEILLKYA